MESVAVDHDRVGGSARRTERHTARVWAIAPIAVAVVPDFGQCIEVRAGVDDQAGRKFAVAGVDSDHFRSRGFPRKPNRVPCREHVKGLPRLFRRFDIAPGKGVDRKPRTKVRGIGEVVVSRRRRKRRWGQKQTSYSDAERATEEHMDLPWPPRGRARVPSRRSGVLFFAPRTHAVSLKRSWRKTQQGGRAP